MRTVSDILREKGRQIWSVTPDTSVYGALRLMADQNVGAVLVLESNKLVGIFSERDYARKVVLKGKSAEDTTVTEVMTERVISVSASHTVEECMGLMTDKHVRHLPVVENHSLLGVISIGDIVKGIISEQRSTIGLLEEYITGGR